MLIKFKANFLHTCPKDIGICIGNNFEYNDHTCSFGAKSKSTLKDLPKNVIFATKKYFCNSLINGKTG
jgi:hypothetical protein